MTLDLFLRSVQLFIELYIIGSLACLPLYHWKFRKFFASTLWTKITWWTPIFVAFQTILYGGTAVAVMVLGLLFLLAYREISIINKWRSPGAIAFIASVGVGLIHLPLFFIYQPNRAVSVITIVCFSSVLSDVGAFFAGKYVGKHPLPRWINDHKSWEGVAGQIIGAIIGLILVRISLGIEASWTLAIMIGVASAMGDLINSTVKRHLAIKDWGQTLPGHGGILDRFASLSYALFFSFWLTVVA